MLSKTFVFITIYYFELMKYDNIYFDFKFEQGNTH